MVRKALLAIVAAVCMVLPAVGQGAGDYLDVLVVRVRPEKAADFNGVVKKMADANRKYNGERWIAMESQFGESNVIAFVGTYSSYAEFDKSQDAFMTAMHKAYGADMSQKILNEWNNDIASSREEFRKRRWDLSRKAPADAAAYAKLVGETRVLRTTAVHVRPGKIAEFEALMADIKVAAEKNDSTQPVLVSQVIEGGNGTIFYVSGLRSEMAGFDKNPSVKDVLGDEGYKKYLQAVADVVESADSMVLRYSPELSAPPDTISGIAPDFWKPKPAPTAKAAKPKAEPAKKE